jgi:hypothetical protein
MDHIQRQMTPVHILILPSIEVNFNIVIHQAASSFHISGLSVALLLSPTCITRTAHLMSSI